MPVKHTIDPRTRDALDLLAAVSYSANFSIGCLLGNDRID